MILNILKEDHMGNQILQEYKETEKLRDTSRKNMMKIITNNLLQEHR